MEFVGHLYFYQIPYMKVITLSIDAQSRCIFQPINHNQYLVNITVNFTSNTSYNLDF